MKQQQYHVTKVVQRMPLFGGFDENEVLALLNICRSTSFKLGTTIYRTGTPSVDMLILLHGILSVISKSGEELAEIHPGGSVGEMGLFTGFPRSADIVTLKDSTVIVIKKKDMKGLLKNNPGMHMKLLYNLISLLRNRLVDADNLVESLCFSGDQDEEEEEIDDE